MVIKNLSNLKGTGNVMEILGFSTQQFDEGFIVAVSLQNKNLIKLLYSNFNRNLIVVEATLLAYKTITEIDS